VRNITIVIIAITACFILFIEVGERKRKEEIMEIMKNNPCHDLTFIVAIVGKSSGVQ
jgi:hypothetical protein